MLNNGAKRVLVLLLISVVAFACSKQEETKPAGVQPAAPAGQTSTAMQQAKGQAMAVSSAAGDQGQAVYRKICAACHDAGVSGAPKIADKAAWSSRLAQGKDHLVHSVINGLGAMPPKAGNPALSEAEIRAAVDYMLGQVR